MTTSINSLFRDKQQRNVFFLLFLSSLFGMALIGVRMHALDFDFHLLQTTKDIAMLRGTSTFFFLIWNLFLAWIPYALAMILERIWPIPFGKFLSAFVLFNWLLFLPNAPYLLTDLLHLKNRAPIPFWYDIMLFLSFAWTGLMLGLVALYEVQLFFRKYFSNRLSWIVVIAAILLNGPGIYIGRFLRWNSWDLITHPIALLNDLLHLLFAPSDFYGSSSMLVIVVFLLLAYLLFVSLADGRAKCN